MATSTSPEQNGDDYGPANRGNTNHRPTPPDIGEKIEDIFAIFDTMSNEQIANLAREAEIAESARQSQPHDDDMSDILDAVTGIPHPTNPTDFPSMEINTDLFTTLSWDGIRDTSGEEV